MTRSVWLDDVRRKPFGFDVWVKTADAAIDALERGDVTLISLDHDLAEEHYEEPPGYGEGALDRARFREKTGYDVVLWMAEHNVWPETILIHTLNPVGRQDMLRLIARHAPESVKVHVVPATRNE